VIRQILLFIVFFTTTLFAQFEKELIQNIAGRQTTTLNGK